MRRKFLSVSAAIICLATAGYAQTPKKGNTPEKANREIARATNALELKRMASDYSVANYANKQMALEMAKTKNWPVRQVSPNGQVMSLEGVDANGFPVYYTTDYNTRAAASVKADQLWVGGSTGLNLSGSNPALNGKLGVWDGGLILGTHQELTGRMVNRDGATVLSGHSTHVAGTMVASGINPLAKGMSYGAANLQGWDFSNDLAEMTAAASELLISNHSYGTIAGWYFNDSRAGTASNPNWEWRGNPNISSVQDLNFGYYNATAQSWDKIAYNAPYYLMVKSAGNNRNQTGPADGQPCWFPNASGVLTLMNRPAGVSSNNGYDIIATYGTAKNILTIGAVDPIPNGWQRKEDVKISTFSSYGPTDDGRIKPDIVANGVAVISSYSTANDAYLSQQGTSMAAPNASGTLNLLQEHYYNTTGGFMRAATLKGLAIHTADEAGNNGPDYIYGWGMLNAEKAANHITNTGGTNLLEERTLDQGQVYTFNVIASGKGPLVVTISWTDVEGQVLAANAAALNNRTPRLVNDLDLRISKGLTTYMPWILDPNNPANSAGLGDNIRDNVEQVYIANAIPGETYTVTISHKGTLSKGPQAYSILASGIGGGAYCLSGATTNGDARINNFTFANINNTPASECTTYRNFTNLIAAVEPGQTLPLSVNLGTCGAENSRIAKVFVDWNADNDFDDAGELIATSNVVSTTSVFSTNITVPASAVVNTQSRIRVVVAETTAPEEVTACGGYLKGETQDYMIRFNPRSKDVGVKALLSPQQAECNNPAQSVAVIVRNYGSATQSNIPVSVVISEGSTTVATLSGTFAGPLEPYSEATYYLAGTFNAQAGKTYTFASSTSLTGDLQASNNQNISERTIGSGSATPIAEANKCGAGPLVLRGDGPGTIFWYDAITGGNLVAAGNNIAGVNPLANNMLYAALNDFAGAVPSPSSSAAGAYSTFTSGRMYFDAEVPFVLEKATINVSTAGTGLRTMTIEVYDKDFSTDVIASTQLVLTPGISEYTLNLPVPAAGKNYSYMVTNFGGGAQAYRTSTTSAAPYPFKIDNVMSITGNNQSVPSSFYYFLYNLKVKAVGCASPRVAVPINQVAEATAVATAAGATTFCEGGSVTLNANQGTNYTYAWYKDGVAIANAKAAAFVATASGNYAVMVTNELGCSNTSAAVTVMVNPLPPTSVSINKNFSLGTCPGDDFSLVMTAETPLQHSGYSYQWYKDGAQISNATAKSYTATASGSYSVTVTTPCGSISSTPTAVNNDLAQIAATGAEICGTSGSASISAQTNIGKLYWFDAATGGNLLHIGDAFTTPTLTQSTNYYVSASNETLGSVGSKNHSAGGSYSNFTGGRMYFDADVPFVLEKATINVATAGTMTVVIVDKDFSNTVIASTIISVTPGVKEYDVNLLVPAAGKNYGIQVSAFGGGATAYRNNTTNSAPYPYALPGIASITGNNQTSPSSFFYFLYDWKVSAASCNTAPRVSVPVIVTPVTVAGALTASTNAVCYGTNAGTVNLSGQTGNVVRWESSVNGTDWATTTDTGSQLQFENLTNTTFYRAMVQSGGCAIQYTAAVKVTVNNLPNPTIQVSTVDKKGYVTLTALPVDNGNTYVWSTGQTTPTIKVKPGDLTYTVTITNSNGCSATSPATMSLPMPHSKASRTLLIAEDVSDVQVYPNPTSGKFTVSYTVAEAGNVKLVLVNSVGQVFYENLQLKTAGAHEQQINLENLPTGMYIMQIHAEGKIQTRKMVVRR